MVRQHPQSPIRAFIAGGIAQGHVDTSEVVTIGAVQGSWRPLRYPTGVMYQAESTVKTRGEPHLDLHWWGGGGSANSRMFVCETETKPVNTASVCVCVPVFVLRQ